MDVVQVKRLTALRRTVGILAGAGTQVLFGATVCGLYWFLAGYKASSAAPSLPTDAVLALFFAVPHSVLRLPRVQKRLYSTIGREFYGVFYCAVTCLQLWVVFVAWQGGDRVLWHLRGVPSAAIVVAFHLSWVALVYSLCISGLGYQTGYTEWSHWMRRVPAPCRRFTPRGAYRWFRHPIYLSFAGLIWFTPRMTVDHALLTVIWTVYLAVGSYLKDQRLAYYMGDAYRQYQSQVPGYPLMPRGPLGKLSTSAAARERCT